MSHRIVEALQTLGMTSEGANELLDGTAARMPDGIPAQELYDVIASYRAGEASAYAVLALFSAEAPNVPAERRPHNIVVIGGNGTHVASAEGRWDTAVIRRGTSDEKVTTGLDPNHADALAVAQTLAGIFRGI